MNNDRINQGSIVKNHQFNQVIIETQESKRRYQRTHLAKTKHNTRNPFHLKSEAQMGHGQNRPKAQKIE